MERQLDGHVWTNSAAAATLRLVGAGAFVPPHVVDNEQIARTIPGWSAEKIAEKTGLIERRFLWPLDIESGQALPPPDTAGSSGASATDMAEKALSDALEMAGLAAADLDVLVVVTCTPDQPRFSHDAMELHRRLGGRRDTHCLVLDSGCGGSLYVLDMLARLAAAESLRHVAVVGTNLTSPLIDRDVYTGSGMVGADGEDVRAYLSTYVFGDGAGAVVLCREPPTGTGIRVSLAGNDHEELVRSPGGGSQSPPYGPRYNPLDHAFVVNGRLVAQSYLRTMRACVSAVTRAAACVPSQVDRLYLHQPNARILRLLTEALEIRADQVATNVARVGNTSSAGMFILLADDLKRGRVTLGSGSTVVLAAVGAGVHYGAQLIQL